MDLFLKLFVVTVVLFMSMTANASSGDEWITTDESCDESSGGQLSRHLKQETTRHVPRYVVKRGKHQNKAKIIPMHGAIFEDGVKVLSGLACATALYIFVLRGYSYALDTWNAVV